MPCACLSFAFSRPRRHIPPCLRTPAGPGCAWGQHRRALSAVYEGRPSEGGTEMKNAPLYSQRCWGHAPAAAFSCACPWCQQVLPTVAHTTFYATRTVLHSHSGHSPTSRRTHMNGRQGRRAAWEACMRPGSGRLARVPTRSTLPGPPWPPRRSKHKKHTKTICYQQAGGRRGAAMAHRAAAPAVSNQGR